MNPKELIVKCYAEQEGGCWVAVCLDFNLASQGDSFGEVKSKLEEQIYDYVYDALAGEDKPYAAQLLSRRAPLSFWLKYYFIKLKIVVWHSAERIFDETMPNPGMRRKRIFTGFSNNFSRYQCGFFYA